MWFVGVDKLKYGCDVFPWYHEPYEYNADLEMPRNKLSFEKTVTVHTLKDLDELERLKEAPSSNIRNIQIQPTDATFLRDRRIIDRIGIVAKELGATILLEGGTLSHAYYQLTRTGAKVEVRYYFEKRQAVEFNKLVRDKIPEKIEKNGEEAIMAELDKKLFSSLLKRKLVEEALEVLDSENDENIVAELADILEVFDGILIQHQIDLKTVLDQKEKKRNKVGGFERGVYLKKTIGRVLANTHKDNNEIPLRAREVLPENRKDFSNYWNLLFYSHGSLSSGMRRCHRCDFTTFPIRRKPIYLGIEILLDQHNRGNCKVREEPHKSYFRLVDDFQKCFFDCVCQFQLLRSSQCI